MRFLQPSLHPRIKLSLHPLKFYTARSCFTSLDLLCVRHYREISPYHVMAYFLSYRHHSYSVVSRGHCAWQGVAS
jgi:hypothetical protein